MSEQDEDDCYSYNSDEVIEMEIEDELTDEQEEYDDEYAFEEENEQQVVNEKKETTSYIVLTEKKILDEQYVQLKHVLDTLQLPAMDQSIEDTMYTLLKRYQWNTEKLLSDYMEFGEAKLLEKCGFNYSSLAECCFDYNPMNIVTESGTCWICMEDDCELISNTECSHAFCGDCWYCYVAYSVSDNVLDNFIPCMSNDCNCILNQSFIYQLLRIRANEDAEKYMAFKSYLKKRVTSYVNDNSLIKWCTSIPPCGKAIKLLTNDQLNNVECDCGHKFCFACGEEQHEPATCSMYAKWKRIIDADACSLQYITLNARNCPKCSVPVEKTSGCDHMRCYACNHKFCWACMDGLGNHTTSSCAKQRIKYLERINKTKNSMFDTSDKYGVYFAYIDRYTIHKTWIQEENETRRHSQRIKNEMSVTSDSNDEEWVDQVFKILMEIRTFLCNCCIFAFYEFNIAQVENIVNNKKSKKKSDVKQEANTSIYKNLFQNFMDQLDGQLSSVTHLLVDLYRELLPEDNKKQKISYIQRNIDQVLVVLQQIEKSMRDLLSDKDMKVLDQK
jgi:ariadne-1